MTQIKLRTVEADGRGRDVFAAARVIETGAGCVPLFEQRRLTMISTSREMALAATLQMIADKILSDDTASGDRVGHAERLQKLAARILVASAKSPPPQAALSLP